MLVEVDEFIFKSTNLYIAFDFFVSTVHVYLRQGCFLVCDMKKLTHFRPVKCNEKIQNKTGIYPFAYLNLPFAVQTSLGVDKFVNFAITIQKLLASFSFTKYRLVTHKMANES